MNNWVKIMSFDRIYEAEIRKQILQNSEIDAVVINAQDSMLMFGYIDLYVKAENSKKASNILLQFQGLTKINSFILKEPILEFQDILRKNNINSIIKEKKTDKYILDNFELYVKNEQVEAVVPFLTGEKIDDWAKVDTCSKVRQTRYKVELLKDHGIKAITIKTKDSDYHLEYISLYVPNEDAEQARNILSKLPNWISLKKYQKREVAELKENTLAGKSIRAIIVESDNKFELFVKEIQKEKAFEIIKNTQEWVEVKSYPDYILASKSCSILQDNNIDASILNIKDSMFLLGGYSVYVEKRKLNEAIELLTEIEGGKITE